MLILLIFIAALMILIERLWPGQQLPEVRGWWLRIALVNATQLGLVILAGYTWDRWMDSVSLFHLSASVGDIPAAGIVYVASTLVYYFWHRIRHESQFFWRLCHQIHHSPQRIEVLTSFYKHPVEILINSLISAALVYGIFGSSLTSAAIYTALTAIAEYFYHWNIRTPRWLGWIIQRPEAHRLHHKFNHHSQNYADLPVWDWIFGTLKNPKTSPKRCGFDEGNEQRILEMLVFRDIHKQAPLVSPTCFGCRKRWACASAKVSCTPDTLES